MSAIFPRALQPKLSIICQACSAVGYCYSAAAPQIAHEYLNLSASEYGSLNILNILGGLSAGRLMQRFSVMYLYS